ncbi:MAG: leucine-rich repeat protein [Rikenellaceae bacterium]
MKRDILLLSTLFVALCGCSQFDGELTTEAYDPSQIYTISVTANSSASDESDDTRISINTSDDTWSLNWESDDAVTGWQGTTTLNAFALSEINTASSKSATFTGEATVGSARFIYPYDADAATDESGNYLLDLAEQSANLSSAYSTYADNYMYMLSDSFTVEVGGSVTSTPTMLHLVAIMELQISVTDISNGDDFVVSSFEIDGLESCASIDFDSGELTTVDNDQKITVAVENAPGLDSGSDLLIPFSALPFTATAETSFSITINFVNGSYVTIDKVGTEDGVPFAAGTHNYLTASFGIDDVKEHLASTHPYLADYSSTSYPTDTDTWIIYDETASSVSDFDGLQSALSSANSESREISLVFPNLLEVPSATSYANGALYNCQAIVSISMPVATSIGSYAFRNCDALASLSLPEAISINKYAFYDCDAISSLNLPEATSIGSSAFESCSSLETVSLPEVTSISSSAFESCSSLETISLPEATSIGSSAFYYCSSLSTISIPKATSINAAVFYGCSALELIDIPTVITSIGINAFYDCTSLKSISLSNITSIGYAAFCNCKALTNVEIPLVTSIDGQTFSGCTALTNLVLPSVTSISGDAAFSSCTSLESIEIATAEDAKLTSIYISTNSFYKDIFYRTITTDVTFIIGSANKEYVSGNMLTVGDFRKTFKEIIVVDAEGNIDTDVNAGVESSLSLSDYSETSYPTDTDTWTITDETASADDFAGLKAALSDISTNDSNREILLKFPNLESFPDEVFYNIDNISYISGSNAVSIGTNAIAYCDALLSVDFPKVTSIGYSAFRSSSVLISVNCASAVSISDCAFRACTILKTISLPEVTSIGKEVFYSCIYLEALSLPEVTSIGESAFYYCRSLETISLPEATSIGESTFQSCSSLETVFLPEATSIGRTAFSGCSSLETIFLPEATSIGVLSFLNCSNLKTISIPKATYIDTSAFSGCSSLETMSLATESTSLSVSSSAFNSCTLSNIDLTTGANNGSTVDTETNYWTVGSNTFGAFNSITVQ